MSGKDVFIMIKPDATERGLGSEILNIFADFGFEPNGFFYRPLTREEAESLYEEHKNKSHFNDLVEYTISGNVAGAWLRREDAVATARNMIGEANPDKRVAGTLRHTYGLDYRRNSVHGSDSDAAAARELKLFFGREPA